MATITPTLSLLSNASTATTPGPLSVALSLSATKALSVDEVQSKILSVSTTHQLLWDASTFTASGTVGADGAWLYFRNMLSENPTPDLLHDIIVSHTGADAADAADAHRLFTLQPGEFAFFPWDCTQDIYVDAMETNTNALECWLFARVGTA
mgnify:FL=1